MDEKHTIQSEMDDKHTLTNQMDEKQAVAKDGSAKGVVLITMPEGVPILYQPACEAIIDAANHTTASRLQTVLSYLHMEQTWKFKPGAVDKQKQPIAYKLWEVDMPNLRGDITENTIKFSKTSASLEGGLASINLALNEAKSKMANKMRFELATMGVISEIDKFSGIVDVLSEGVDKATKVTLDMLKAVSNQAGNREYSNRMTELIKWRKAKVDLETSPKFFQDLTDLHTAQAELAYCQKNMTHVENSIRVCQAARDQAAEIAARATQEAYQKALEAANAVPIRNTSTSTSGFWFWKKSRTHVDIDNTPVDNANDVRDKMEKLKNLANQNDAQRAESLDRLKKDEANCDRALKKAQFDVERAQMKIRPLREYEAKIKEGDEYMKATAKNTGVLSGKTTLVFLNSVNSLHNGITQSFVGANTLRESMKVISGWFTRQFAPDSLPEIPEEDSMAAFLDSCKCGAIMPVLDAVGLSTTQNVRDLFALDDPDEVDDVMQEIIYEADQLENSAEILRKNRHGEVDLKKNYHTAIKTLGIPLSKEDRDASERYVMEVIDNFLQFMPHIHRELKVEIERVGNIGDRDLLPESERRMLIEELTGAQNKATNGDAPDEPQAPKDRAQCAKRSSE